MTQHKEGNGQLYVVATPIGNMGDFSQRAIEVLQQVDLIAAEDTRHSGRLLQQCAITTPLVAYHDHNEEQQTARLIDKLLAGTDVALISDAGTPLLSDPGYRLVKAAHSHHIRVSPVPGSCAAIAALSVSGLATDRFCFGGFPPAKSSARKGFYESFRQYPETLIFYESCHRIVKSVEDMLAVFGPHRMCVIARELTKTFETIHCCELQQAPAWLQADDNQRKGEFVVLLEGAEQVASQQSVELESLLAILLQELPVRQASQLAAKISGENRNKVYKMALALKSDGDD